MLVNFDLTHGGNLGLHAGEKSLIVYAHELNGNVWFLNSPDIATVKYACSQVWNDQLISLEAMVKHLKLKPVEALGQNYTDEGINNFV